MQKIYALGLELLAPGGLLITHVSVRGLQFKMIVVVDYTGTGTIVIAVTAVLILSKLCVEKAIA